MATITTPISTTQFSKWPGSAATSSSSITVDGTLVLKGSNSDIIVDGASVKDMFANVNRQLEKINERLCILQSNDNMENQWDELRALGTQYRELERLCLEKSAAWNLLGGNNHEDKS